MTDGPNIDQLFYDMSSLNAEHNLKDIYSRLRGSKGNDNYQKLLNHYLPMLPKKEFDEFIGDVELLTDEKVDKEATKGRLDEINAKWKEKHVKEPTKEALAATEKLSEKELEKAKKEEKLEPVKKHK